LSATDVSNINIMKKIHSARKVNIILTTQYMNGTDFYRFKRDLSTSSGAYVFITYKTVTHSI